MSKDYWRIALCGLGLLILTVLPSAAQYPIPEALGLNYSLTAGVAFLVGENINNTTAVSVGVSWYDLASDELGHSAAVGLSADWLLVERNDGTNVSIVPVFLNYRQYGIIGAWRTFVNFGIGVLGVTKSVPEMELGTGAGFGWTGGLGVDISNNIYVQARFIGGRNPGNDGMASIQLGYRF